MRIVGRSHLDEFCRLHAAARSPVGAWLADVSVQSWTGPQDVKARYSAASFLDGNRVIFNIGGNKYRLEVRFTYRNGIATVLRIGTHAEYDRWKGQ